MLITTFNELLKKSHRSRRYKNFLRKITNWICFRQLIPFFFRYKIIIHQYSKCRRNQTRQNILWKDIFNCKNYSHIKGSLMGTICPPSYANILMEHFEGKFIYPPIKTFLLIYLRFIDDIFFMWTGSQKDLENLLNKLNAERRSIKFKCKVSKETIFFSRHQNIYEKQQTTYQIFRKKTNAQAFPD